MSDWKAKRFWKDAAVVAVEDGFTVELDGRRVKTPAKRLLTLPTRASPAGLRGSTTKTVRSKPRSPWNGH